MELKTKLKELRPDASAATIRTYNSLLKGMFYKKHPKDADINIEWFKNVDEVLDTLKDKTPQSRKTNLAAIIVLLDNKGCDKYAELMYKDADHTSAENKKQQKSEKQKENWMNFEEIKNVWNTHSIRANRILASKEPISSTELNELIKFMVLTLTSGIYFPPRRSEWVSMKIRNYDAEKDNYVDMKKSEFVFNSYKTHKTLGQERIPYPKQFKLLLNRYLKKVGDNDYLIFNTKGGPLSNATLTQMLNSLFGKKIGTSMLRHIYLSDKFKDIPKLEDLQKTADSLGHSVGQMLEYVKH